jgi:hypothetical protein
MKTGDWTQTYNPVDKLFFISLHKVIGGEYATADDRRVYGHRDFARYILQIWEKAKERA